MATNHKSRSAILAGAKSLIAELGSYQANMIDIAARAAVSRATVYNHFTDKSEMFSALIESEINRLSQEAKSSATPADALYLLSRAISEDPALATLRTTDPLDIARLVSKSDHALWKLVSTRLHELFGNHSELVLRWLLGQLAAPLSASESRAQADQLVFALQAN